MSFDYERANILLDIVTKVANASPGFTSLSGEAMAELRVMNEDLRKAAEIKAGREPTPAQYGDGTAPHIGAADPNDPQLNMHPTASAPVDKPKSVLGDTPPVERKF